MCDPSVVIEMLELIHSFLNKLGLPSEFIALSSIRERLQESEPPNELICEHLGQLCKGLQEKLTAVQNMQQTKRQKLDTDVNTTNTCLDPSLVQVVADKAEIDRRITAFVQSKQNDVDLLNKREFCSMVNTQNNNDFSCARVDAQFIPRFGQSSHIKVTQVDNTSSVNEAQALRHVSGRQQTGTSRHKEMTSSSTGDTGTQAGVIDRLVCMEMHLGMSPGRPVPVDVYQRLKSLEQRIIFLEGLSPEYFQCGMAAHPSSNKPFGREQTGETSDKDGKGMSIEAIDDRINSLKRSLTRGATVAQL